jgi:Rab guanine nucleotide exchange factor SEC2
MAAVITAPGLPVSRYSMDTDSLTTLPDPRSPVEAHHSPAGSGTSTPHPELNTEVASLSNKLISAINHQTHLDDALSSARQELEAAQSRIKVLETEQREHARQIENGQLVKKEAMDEVLGRFGEHDRRTQVAEQEKKRMEQELENLTSTLFEEANEVWHTAVP